MREWRPVIRKQGCGVRKTCGFYLLEESERLLDELWSYAARPEFVWRQDWRVGDVIIWDNRCSLHRRDEFDPALRRLLRRCQVLAKVAA
jgi:taurine dioxygenase